MTNVIRNAQFEKLVFRRKGFVSVTDNKMVVDKHYQYCHSEKAYDAQHYDHYFSPFSMVIAKKRMTTNKNTTQNIIFCGNNKFVKNSPAKYPAKIIFAKSPINFDIDSLDLGLNHSIVRDTNNTLSANCQANCGGGACPTRQQDVINREES